MTTIYPHRSDEELDTLPSRAEAKVYRRLRALDFPGLIVIHSLATQTRNAKGTWVGEIDFLLFHPHYGFQLWEVKGGGVWLEADGHWYSQGNHGTHRLTTTPLEQLKKQTGSLLQAMGKVVGDLRLPVAPVLVFPDVGEWRGEMPVLALNRDHLLLKSDLEALTADDLARRFTNAPLAGPHAANDLPLTKQQAKLIEHHLLRPACALVGSVVEQARDVEASLLRLGNEQQWVLRLLEYIPRMAIHGGAGTGKSILARLRAEQLAREGKRVLLLCFNTALAEAHRQALFEDDALRIEALTFHELCEQRARVAGLGWQVPVAPGEKGTFYNETAPDLLVEALHRRPDTFDALVVDEAQDYESYWWLALNELLASEAQVTLFADPAQNLYGRDYQLPVEVFTGMVPYPFMLHRNYRNALEIATWLRQHHAAAAEPGDHLPSSERGVETLRWKTPEQQYELARTTLDSLEAEGFTPEQILLLTPFRVEKSEVLTALATSHPQYAARMYNVSAVKGLDASVVLLMDIGNGTWASDPKVEYVGASRAKVLLKLFRKVA
nr:NERD domain-containing protein/DEAD/DEAH box helicase [uncultured Halomonas sp.]